MNNKKPIFGCTVTLISVLLCIFVFILYWISPAVNTKNRTDENISRLQYQIDCITERAQNGETTPNDRAFLSMIYHSMIIGAAPIYPEASRILNHYLFGNGKDIQLSAHYIRRSPVVRNAINGRNHGTIGPIGFRITDDERLAYAVNPFYVDIENDGKYIYYRFWQYIKFHRSSRNTYTVFYLPGFQFRMNDGLVYVFEETGGCKPFTTYATWREKIK